MRTPAHRASARDWTVDVACVTLSLLVAAVVVLVELEGLAAEETSALYFLVATVVGVLSSAAVWWRRRWPVGLAVLLLPMAALTESTGGAVLVAVFTVAVHRSWRVAVAFVVLHTLTVVPYSILNPDPDLTIVGFHLLGGTLLSLAAGWGMLVRRRRALVTSLRERATYAEAEARSHAERVRGLERERIAREMHDVLAHRISMVSVHAGALEIRSGDMSASEIAGVAGTIRASAHLALEELREILGLLRVGVADDEGPGLRPQPGLTELDRLVSEARSTGTPVCLDNRLTDLETLAASVDRTAYRVVQEGLTNARKHAPGAQVRVRLDHTAGGELHVRLSNRLAGAATAPAVPGSRTGLVGLSERVSLAGGRIDHGARRALGGAIDFHLEAWMPWPT